MSANPATFQTSAGQLVPVDPQEPQDRLAQERREEQINAPKLLAYLNKTLDAITELDQSENLKIHNEMVRCVAYYDGRSDGQVRNGEWVDNPKITGEIQPADNEYKKQIDKLLMEMSRGRIGYEAEAVNKFSAEQREAAQFIEHRIQVNQDRIETEPFIQRENMSLVLKGDAYRYTFFDQSAESSEKSIQVQAVKNLIQGAKVTVCRTCGMTAPPKSEAKVLADNAPDRDSAFEATEVAAQNCPHCGDTETTEVASPDSEGLEIKQEKVSAGRVVTVQPDATMVQLDLSARDIPSSLFLRWRIVMRRCDWEAMFPNTRIPSSGESTEARHQSESQNQPSNSGWNTSSDNTGGGQFEKIEGELVWLDPKVYQRYRNKESETLKGGKVLPAGEALVEAYPTGACVARIRKTVLDIFPSNKNKCWMMCVYGQREHALHGSGTAALLGPQDTINDENAFIVAHHYYSASGRDFVRSGAIQGGQLPAYNQVAYIDGCPEDRDVVSWAYGRSQPEALASDVYGFRNEMRGSIQDAAGTSSLSNQGAADMKALGTATGVEASRDQAVGRMIPNRKLQAFMGAEWAKQVLELEREHYTPDMFLESAGKSDEKGEVEYTERGVSAFFNSDVRTDFMVRAAEGSWVPTTPAQERANAASFAQAAAQLQDPKLLAVIAPSLGVDYSVDEWGAAQRNASMRLEEYARVSKIVADGGYPASPEMVDVVLTNTAEWARVNPEMDNHAAFRDFYEDWWLSDEGRNADSLLRLVVQTVHGLHLNKGMVKQAQDQSAAAIAAKAPEMVAQEQIANQQKQQQDAQAAEADDQGKADQVESAVGQQLLTQHDREHQAQIDIAKREHEAQIQAELKDHEAAAQADLETHTAVLGALTSENNNGRTGD